MAKVTPFSAGQRLSRQVGDAAQGGVYEETKDYLITNDNRDPTHPEGSGQADSDGDKLTIKKLREENRLLRKQLATQRDNLLKYNAVKLHLAQQDVIVKTLQEDLKESAKKIDSLTSQCQDITREKMATLKKYHREVQQGDIARRLCLELEEENKRLGETIEVLRSRPTTPATPTSFHDTMIFPRTSTKLGSRSDLNRDDTFVPDAPFCAMDPWTCEPEDAGSSSASHSRVCDVDPNLDFSPSSKDCADKAAEIRSMPLTLKSPASSTAKSSGFLSRFTRGLSSR